MIGNNNNIQSDTSQILVEENDFSNDAHSLSDLKYPNFKPKTCFKLSDTTKQECEDTSSLVNFDVSIMHTNTKPVKSPKSQKSSKEGKSFSNLIP
jgi:hypothetical protein